MNGNTMAIAEILVGTDDEKMLNGLRKKREMDVESGRYDPDEQYVVEDHLQRMKDYLRLLVQRAINDEIKAEKDVERFRKGQRHKELIEQMKAATQPHPMGTVAELAQKLGVSKSEIRRRKTDNTLGELIMEKGLQQ